MVYEYCMHEVEQFIFHQPAIYLFCNWTNLVKAFCVSRNLTNEGPTHDFKLSRDWLKTGSEEEVYPVSVGGREVVAQTSGKRGV